MIARISSMGASVSVPPTMTRDPESFRGEATVPAPNGSSVYPCYRCGLYEDDPDRQRPGVLGGQRRRAGGAAARRPDRLHRHGLPRRGDAVDHDAAEAQEP